MELKFIWIEEYKNIKNKGFNFNHSIDEEFQFFDNEISIIPKLNNTTKFFLKDNISGVTTIVGKNGSGKTNLTEFINYNLAHATNGGLSTYIKSKGIVILNKWIFVQDKIIIKNEVFLKSKGYLIIRFENAPLDVGQGELRWHSMEDNKYIYYNPTFDLRAIPVQDNLVNISTTMLVYNDIYNSEKLYSYAVMDKKNISQLDAFEIMEKSRICDFILNFENANKYINFLPEKIAIAIDTEENNYFLKKKYYYGEELNEDKDKNEKINSLQRDLDNLESSIIYYENYEEYFVRQRERSTTKYYNIPINKQKNIFFRLFFIKIFQGLLNNDVIFPKKFFRIFLYGELENNSIEDIHKLEQVTKLKQYILEIIDKADWYEFELPLPDDEFLESGAKKNIIYKHLGNLEISISENKILLNNAIALMDSMLDNKRVFSYETLKQFSSGQMHILTLYSRFFWAKNKIKKSEIGHYGIKGESIIIFIDEGEVALHPEWQRVFFNKVSSFLSELFNDKKIQLILTTHSPFVLSDMPKENVIFLESDEKGNSIISNMEKENTFGANIYSLLSDSFFMQNTIGEFAEGKMKWALEILKSDHKDYSEDKLIELKYIIDSIGEPIIKERFEYLFNINFVNDEVNTLKERITKLENQLKQQMDDTDKN